MLNRKPTQDRQAPLTRFALAHPRWLAICSGLVISLWTLVIVGDMRAVAGAGMGLTAVVWLAWNSRGPARRREERLWNSDGTPRT